MFFNALIIALREIRRNLTRAFLTVLGVVIGVAAVITMVTLGRGATEMVKTQISSLGSNLLVLRSGQGWGGGGAPLFSKADVRAIEDQVPGIKYMAPLARGVAPAVFLQNVRITDIQGTTPIYFEIANWKIQSGRFFDQADLIEGAPVCVIGETIRKELFGKEDAIGKKIRLRNTSVLVIGTTLPKGQGGWGDDLDDNIIMPITTLQRRLNGQLSNQNIDQVMISGKSDYPSANVVADISSLMRERRGLKPNELDNFSVSDTRQIADAVSSSTAVMTSLLGAVAGVSLLVGGIGIMNIMLVSVTERTREIGIRLAIGALERDVLLQFLIEAVVLSSFGGLAGILIALAASFGLARMLSVPLILDPGMILLAFLFAVAVGVVFGYFPARKAARLDPIEALRFE